MIHETREKTRKSINSILFFSRLFACFADHLYRFPAVWGAY